MHELRTKKDDAYKENAKKNVLNQKRRK